MLNALLAIIPITILFFWFQSMGDKKEEETRTDDLDEFEKYIS